MLNRYKAHSLLSMKSWRQCANEFIVDQMHVCVLCVSFLLSRSVAGILDWSRDEGIASTNAQKVWRDLLNEFSYGGRKHCRNLTARSKGICILFPWILPRYSIPSYRGPMIKALRFIRILQIDDLRFSSERHAIESCSFSPSFQISRARFQFSESLYERLRRSHLRTETRLLFSVFSFLLLFYSFALLLASIAGRKSFERNSPREKYFLSVYLERPRAVSNLFSTDAVRYTATCLEKGKERKKRSP